MIAGWRSCMGCGAAWALASDAPCPRCGDALEVSEAPAWAVDPTRSVRSVVDLAEARRRLKAFVAPVAFPAGGLAADATSARLVRIDLPRWHVDVDVRTTFRLEAGFETDVKSTVEAYSLGRWISREVTERRLHWEPRAGTVCRRYPDLVVPASGWDLPGSDGPCDPEPITPRLATGPVAVPDRGPEEQWPWMLAALRERVARDCAEACEASSVRALELGIEVDQAAFAWVLVPAWITWYRDEDGRRHTLLVDGKTGRVTGPRMASPTSAAAHARTASLLAAGLGVLGLFVGLLGLVVWVLLPLATLCLLAALAGGARALVLPRRIAAWNRSELLDPGK